MLLGRNAQPRNSVFSKPMLRPFPALRWYIVLGASALVLLVFALVFTAASRGGVHPGAADGLVESVSSAVMAAATASPTAPQAPSMLDSALAKMQRTSRAWSDASEGTTGSQQATLSHRDFQQLSPLLGQAEAQLIEIYQRIGQGQHRQALAQAEALVQAHPNFHLAQLVLGDLLTLQTRPVRLLGDVPDAKASAAAEQLAVLRDESRRRLRALIERPAEGHIPTQFLALAPQSRHAIAIDASRSRLYLFENTAARPNGTNGTNGLSSPNLRLLGDYYISVGLSGIEKTIEGDKRTPLGVYYITSNLNPSGLPDLYGVGALPINYPNPLDTQRGKTGSGIWLHGTPREQFVRAPQASDGCVVLSNPDLERLLSTVQIRTTPVVIAPELKWVDPATLDSERQAFETALERWRNLKSQGRVTELKGFYAERFRSQGRDLAQWWPRVEAEIRDKGLRELELKDISVLHWRDSDDTMVVTFGEVVKGQTRGITKRQYWILENNQWKIFFEGAP